MTDCEHQNDIGGCMIKCDCYENTPEKRAKVGCFLSMDSKGYPACPNVPDDYFQTELGVWC